MKDNKEFGKLTSIEYYWKKLNWEFEMLLEEIFFYFDVVHLVPESDVELRREFFKDGFDF